MIFVIYLETFPFAIYHQNSMFASLESMIVLLLYSIIVIAIELTIIPYSILILVATILSLTPILILEVVTKNQNIMIIESHFRLCFTSDY